TPTEVAVELDVTDGVDAASLRLVRTSAPTTPLCTLAALPGDPAGRFGCTVTIDEPAATLVPLAVEAQANGARVLSPGFRLPVVAPDTHGVAVMAAASTEATRLWVDAKARLGDTLAARMETLRALQTVPGILSAALSPNGIDIVVRYTNGWQGGLVLNRPPPAAVAPAAVHPASTVRPAPRGVFRSCGDDPSAGICCPLDRRTLLAGRDVFIWDTGFFPDALDDGPTIRKKFDEHACLGHQVQTLRGAAADVASMAQFTAHSTLVLSTHGMIDENGRVAICTGEEVREPESDEKYRDLVMKGWVFTGFGPELGTKQYLCMSIDYVASLPGRFPEHAVVYASHCYSGYGSAPAAYRAKGAGAYYGFDWAVDAGYTTNQVAPQLFDGLLKDLRTTGKAYDAVEPKTDPTPHPRKVLDPTTGRFSEIPGVAHFVFAGDPDLAYTGKPKLEGEFATLEAGEQTTLEVTVEGAEMCDLTHHWVATGERGNLAGGNDVEGTMRSLEFTAVAPPNSGVDDIGVEVLPPDSDEPIGVACGGVVVDATCGDGRRQGTERCDDADLGICTAGCTESCLCGTTTSTTTTSTTSTTFFECTVGVASDCPATQCCDAGRRECCDPLNDPAGTCNPGGGLTPSGCCSDDGFPSQCAGDPGTTFPCPVTCESGQLYVCIFCDGKKIDHVE
ncbi:MAG TPA: hypothetical protein VGR62_06815, partial [Candidatus Binatia bacterium]|nr:hypothetical protein [Candidatus Binatia bacterium]